jgi:DNA-binding NarL/FixJ family response regulator
VERAVTLEADVVLMDVRMPRSTGSPRWKRSGDGRRAGRVVMLTTFDDEEYVVTRAARRRRRVPVEGPASRELAGAVRMAHAGVAQFDRAATARVAAALSPSTVDAKPGCR